MTTTGSNDPPGEDRTRSRGFTATRGWRGGLAAAIGLACGAAALVIPNGGSVAVESYSPPATDPPPTDPTTPPTNPVDRCSDPDNWSNWALYTPEGPGRSQVEFLDWEKTRWVAHLRMYCDPDEGPREYKTKDVDGTVGDKPCALEYLPHTRTDGGTIVGDPPRVEVRILIRCRPAGGQDVLWFENFPYLNPVPPPPECNGQPVWTDWQLGSQMEPPGPTNPTPPAPGGGPRYWVHIYTHCLDATGMPIYGNWKHLWSDPMVCPDTFTTFRFDVVPQLVNDDRAIVHWSVYCPVTRSAAVPN